MSVSSSQGEAGFGSKMKEPEWSGLRSEEEVRR